MSTERFSGTLRTVAFHMLHEPDDGDPEYVWQCRVTLTWLTDGDNAARQENAHGQTEGEAWAMARRIAAAFMFEDHVDSESWPDNNIDHLGEPSSPTHELTIKPGCSIMLHFA